MMIKDLIDYYLLGGRKRFKSEQNKLAYMMLHSNHDVSMLPGGYYIHHSICYCKEPR